MSRADNKSERCEIKVALHLVGRQCTLSWTGGLSPGQKWKCWIFIIRYKSAVKMVTVRIHSQTDWLEEVIPKGVQVSEGLHSPGFNHVSVRKTKCRWWDKTKWFRTNERTWSRAVLVWRGSCFWRSWMWWRVCTYSFYHFLPEGEKKEETEELPGRRRRKVVWLQVSGVDGRTLPGFCSDVNPRLPPPVGENLWFIQNATEFKSKLRPGLGLLKSEIQQQWKADTLSVTALSGSEQTKHWFWF